MQWKEKSSSTGKAEVSPLKSKGTAFSREVLSERGKSSRLQLEEDFGLADVPSEVQGTSAHASALPGGLFLNGRTLQEVRSGRPEILST